MLALRPVLLLLAASWPCILGVGGARSAQATTPERPPLERRGVLELTLPEPAGVRTEWFRIDALGADTEELPLGVARLVRVPAAGGGARLEWETHWFAEDVRLFHAERLEPESVSVVRREIGGGGGRTLRVGWSLATNALEVVDVGGPDLRRRELDAGEGLCTPLFLLEGLRQGRLSAGAFRRLEPGAGVAEEVVLRLDLLAPPRATGLRVATWRRADGTLAGRYLLFGEGVKAYQLQSRGPVARAVSEAEYATLRRRRGLSFALR